MRATATSNVLMLVDGVRLNENDLSGADLSIIPLSQIERGGGSVRYGSGAVGGVVNIITKRAAPGQTHLEALVRAGSYATTDLRLNAGASAGPLSATVNLSKLDSDGYRENGGIAARDGSVELGLIRSGALGTLDVYVRAAHHHGTSGLPGPVGVEPGLTWQPSASFTGFASVTKNSKRAGRR